MTEAPQEQDQRLLHAQLKKQLRELDAQEENLLDLLADPGIPRARVKECLVSIGRERGRLNEQLGAVATDLSDGAAFLEASMALLENPWDLYKDASDEVRRHLNHAIFARIYISDEQVTGIAMNDPFGPLFGVEAAHAAASARLDDEAIEAAFRRAYAEHTGTKQKTAPKGGLLYSNSVTTAWAYLFTDSSSDGVSNKPHMVEMGGIEPPSIAGTLRLLRAQSVETFCSAPTFVTDT